MHAGLQVIAAVGVVFGLVLTQPALGQQPEQPSASPSQPVSAQQPDQPAASPFKPEELDQILAPIALYPDELIAQILTAATYPLEIVLASRWVADPKNAALKGDALAKALEGQSWDASVKSLVPFPSVLKMMSDKLDWTQKLGDAFLSQEADCLAAVQSLRRKAAGPVSRAEMGKIIEDYAGWEIAANTAESVLEALEIEERYKISFWDALIVQAAENNGVEVLYSEDLADGQEYGGVRVVNPLK